MHKLGAQVYAGAKTTTTTKKTFNAGTSDQSIWCVCVCVCAVCTYADVDRPECLLRKACVLKSVHTVSTSFCVFLSIYTFFFVYPRAKHVAVNKLGLGKMFTLWEFYRTIALKGYFMHFTRTFIVCLLLFFFHFNIKKIVKTKCTAVHGFVGNVDLRLYFMKNILWSNSKLIKKEQAFRADARRQSIKKETQQLQSHAEKEWNM